MGAMESEYLPLISKALEYQRDVALGKVAASKGEEAEDLMAAYRNNTLETWLGMYLDCR